MTRIVWGVSEESNYEFGVDRGVFYPKNGVGYAWSGLTSVKESTVDATQSLIYVDGEGAQSQVLLGNFAATVEAISYPKEFEPYDGYDRIFSGQRRRRFDFCYRSMQKDGHYKLHLVYNATTEPTPRNNSSINQAVDTSLFSWEFTTRPEQIPGVRASSHFVIDTRSVYPAALAAIEDRLYGNDASAPDMPTVPELLAIFDQFALFRVTPHGDGTVTISGLDTAVFEVEPTLWELDWPSVIQVDDHTYHASSL